MKNLNIWNNKDFQLKRILDYKGTARALAFQNFIIAKKMNQYFFKNWPFAKQTPQELIKYLWEYGKVIYLNIPGVGLQFFPFSSSKPFLTRGNVHLAQITIKGDFNKRIMTSAFVSKQAKEKFPFIFMNPMQTAPKEDYEIHFDSLKAVFNSNASNRQNKNKSHIVFIPAGAKYNKAIYEYYTNPDASPFYYIENKRGNKNENLSASDFQQMTTNTQDLYSSYSQEERDIKQEIKIANGVISNTNFNKGSAQETDGQTEDQKIETAINLKDQLDEIRRGLKNLRSNTDKQVEIFFTDEVFRYVNNAIQLGAVETDADDTPEEQEEKISLSVLDRIKNLLGLTKEKPPETMEEQEEQLEETPKAAEEEE